MSWKSIKNLLLLLLTAVNLLLFFFAYTYYQKREFTDTDTAKQAAEILEKGGISVPYTLLAVQNDTADMLRCSYDREEYLCYAAALLFGEEAEGIYLLPEGIRAETRSGKVADLGNDFYLRYVDPSMGDGELQATLARAKVLAEQDCSVHKEALEALLALPAGALADTPCLHAGNYSFLTVTQTENSIPLYGMRCSFGFAGDKLIYAEGKYCFSIPEEKSSEPLLNRTNILYSEKERGKTGRITEINLCYTLYEDAQNGALLFVPAYALTYADGGSTAVSAISGEAYAS